MDYCIEEYMAFKIPSVSASWAVSLKSILRHIRSAIGTMPIGEVTREGIDIYLERNPWSQDTRANHRKVLNMFFEWAVDTDRISVHPVKKSKTIALRHGTPKILTLEEAERFLRLGEKDDPGLVYAMILGLFAGIRGQEVCRMR